MILQDLLIKTYLDSGFYVTDLRDKCVMLFECADDYYEKSFSKYMSEREVEWFQIINGKLDFILKK